MEHSLEEKLAAIKMVEDGQSARSVSDKRKIIDANKHSEPFLMWINGEPYV